MFWLQCIVTFLAVAISDIFWVLCVNKVKEENALHAAGWAVPLLISGAVGVVGYVDNHWLLIPASLGAFVGTYMTVKMNKQKAINDYTCNKCGWNKRHPVDNLPLVEVNHIDGNAENCAEENLEVLCPNCHSETYNF